MLPLPADVHLTSRPSCPDVTTSSLPETKLSWVSEPCIVLTTLVRVIVFADQNSTSSFKPYAANVSPWSDCTSVKLYGPCGLNERAPVVGEYDVSAGKYDVASAVVECLSKMTVLNWEFRATAAFAKRARTGHTRNAPRTSAEITKGCPGSGGVKAVTLDSCPL